MNYLALNKEQLLRFSHHWFWGLRVDIPQHDTFFSAAERLQKNPEELERVKEHVARISQNHWAIRALHWAFNWAEYRLHYYEMQAYFSWQLYQKGNSKLSNSDRLGEHLPGVFLVATGMLGLLLGGALYPYLTQSLGWFSQHMQTFYPKSEEFEVVNETIDDAMEAAPRRSTALVAYELRRPDEVNIHDVSETVSFTVTDEMCSALETLGLTKNKGDNVLFRELKTAYLKRCLETHPDKTHEDTGAAFRKVTEAYDTLISIIERDISPGSESVGSESSLIVKMNELRREMQKEIPIWRNIAEEARQLNERARQVNERARQLNQRARQLNEQERKQSEVIKGLTTDYVEMNKRVRALQVQLGLPPMVHQSPDDQLSAVVEAAPTSSPPRFFHKNLGGGSVDNSTIQKSTPSVIPSNFSIKNHN